MNGNIQTQLMGNYLKPDASESPQSSSPANGQFESRWRQLKSCKRCHRLKIKCTFKDPSFKSCSRCFAIGVECSPDVDPTAKFAKKKTRKTKSEVDPVQKFKELLASAQSTLSSMAGLGENERNNLAPLVDDFSRLSESITKTVLPENTAMDTDSFQKLHKLEFPGSDIYPNIEFNCNLAQELVFKHNLISLQEAKLRFQFFHEEMLPYYPMLSFSYELSDFDYLMQNSPMILLACIYVTTVNDNGLSAGATNYEKRTNNRAMNRLLMYYIESFLSYHVYIRSQDFTYHLIYASLILSLWCLPPHNVGHFKSQINLLTAYNISLCINSGRNSSQKTSKLLLDNSHERNDLRIFLSVYCCCGSLGLSLPRYKLVTWSNSHSNAITKLLTKDSANDLPKRIDRYLCYYSKAIYLGQEMLDFLSLTDITSAFDSYNNDKSNSTETMIHKLWDRNAITMSNSKIILDNYERKLYLTLVDSGFMITPTKEKPPKEKHLLSIVYYHILMIVYDNLISGYLYSRKAAFMQPESSTFFDDTNSLIYLQHIGKLITTCENLLKTFIKLNSETMNYPTFVYYRALHALTLLIRLQLLVKSHSLSPTDNSLNLEINVEYFYDKIQKIVIDGQTEKDLLICSKMAFILNKIHNWMKVSVNYKSQPNVVTDNELNGKSDANANFIKLTDMSKDQEIENLQPPKSDVIEGPLPKRRRTEFRTASPASRSVTPVQILNNSHGLPPMLKVSDDPSETYTLANSASIQEIFKEINTDVLSYLNPLELNFEFNDAFGMDDFMNGFGTNDSNIDTLFAQSKPASWVVWDKVITSSESFIETARHLLIKSSAIFIDNIHLWYIYMIVLELEFLGAWRSQTVFMLVFFQLVGVFIKVVLIVTFK